MSKRRRSQQDLVSISVGMQEVGLMKGLLSKVCIKLGFCGGERRLTVGDFVADSPVDRTRFAEMVLAAEGCSSHHECKPELEAMFSEAFGERFAPQLTSEERISLG